MSLEEAQLLIEQAREQLKDGDFLDFLTNLKKSMLTSIMAVLRALGMTPPETDNLLRLYLSIPAQYRPAIGEPEFEIFEYKYGLAVYNMSGAVPLEKEFLESSLDLAERVLYWAQSLIRTLAP